VLALGHPGLRGIIVWLCLTSLALGAVLEQVWLLVFGGLWLLEEIYETGVLALILRSGEGQQKGGTPNSPAGILGPRALSQKLAEGWPSPVEGVRLENPSVACHSVSLSRTLRHESPLIFGASARNWLKG
jgi:hypothetical protein